MMHHVVGLFTHPDQEWRQIRSEDESIRHLYLTHTLLLAAIPAVAAFIGTTQVGWVIGNRAPVVLTQHAAAWMALMSYAAMLGGVAVMGTFIHWMARTYDKMPTMARSVAFATHTATPLFIGGVAALYPHLWLGMLAGLAAVAYTVYLLYVGLPTFMGLNEDEGFLFSSSVLAVGLIVLVAIIALSVIIWGLGVGPVYALE
ncbi:MAG: Yip1 family protein [Janthinobacterium lividum]|uniref:Yip1 family protein n=1 Tax=Pseudomonas baltica TaxID=2762576 RepID=UPI00289E077E|nr:Yip1 family protein [Pseudomonas baltica]